MNIDLKAIDFDDVFEYLKWILLAAIVCGLLIIGYQLGQSSADEDIAKRDQTIAVQRMAIEVQATRIREINSEAKKAIAAEKVAKQLAANAGKIAEKAERKAADLETDYAKRLKNARKKPDCEALLSVDVRKICGL